MLYWDRRIFGIYGIESQIFSYGTSTPQISKLNHAKAWFFNDIILHKKLDFNSVIFSLASFGDSANLKLSQMTVFLRRQGKTNKANKVNAGIAFRASFVNVRIMLNGCPNVALC